MRKSVCIDLDGVLAQYDGWKGVDHIGDPLPHAVELTKRIAEFADIVIFTARCNAEVGRGEGANLLRNRVRDWLDKHNFVYHDIYIGQGKPIASAYIDDRAIEYRPQKSVFPELAANRVVSMAQLFCGCEMNGKGDRNRTTDRAAFRDNVERKNSDGRRTR